MTLHLDCTFISPDDILKGVTEVLLGPCKSLHLVRFSNKLAVGTTAKRPSQSSPTSKDRAEGDGVALLRQEAVKLIGSSFVVSSHLLFHDLFNFSGDL